MWAPMPPAAPVIRATLPLNSIEGTLLRDWASALARALRPGLLLGGRLRPLLGRGRVPGLHLGLARARLRLRRRLGLGGGGLLRLRRRLRLGGGLRLARAR